MPMPENPTTKEKIFFAGVKIFGREGYKGATVRDICQEAGAANASAVNYYYGGKAGLYKTILDVMFAEMQKRWAAEEEACAGRIMTPEENLRRALTLLVDILFTEHEISDDFAKVLLREMMTPSEHLDDLVENYVRQDNAAFAQIIQSILGEGVPDEIVRDSLVSVAGQVYYYLTFWPIFRRIYPEHPGVSRYKTELVDHIMLFSMGGLNAVRAALENSEKAP